MQVHEFYSKYANTKIPARTELIPVTEKFKQYNYGLPVPSMLSLCEIYDEVNRLEEAMRPMQIRQQTLIEMAQEHMIRNQA